MTLQRLKERIIIDELTGCWNWQGSCNSSGYGQITVDKVYYTTHRYSYILHKGDIPQGLLIRHMCHNTKCCNPDHLQTGTDTDNWKDSEHNHIKASEKQRLKWFINGVSYSTLREASHITKLHHMTIIKYTDKTTRVFDIVSYRSSCLRSNKIPKL